MDQPTNFNLATNKNAIIYFDYAPNFVFNLSNFSIPEISTQPMTASHALHSKLYQPGQDIDFGQLNFTFFVNEELEEFFEIHKWIRGNSSSIEEQYRQEWEKLHPRPYCDAVVTLTNSTKHPFAKVIFEQIMPASIGALEYSSTDEESYLTCTANFVYNRYYFEVNQIRF